MLLHACKNLKYAAKCNYVGNPDVGGLPFVSILSQEESLRSSIISSCETEGVLPGGPCFARYIEVDGTVEVAQPHYPILSNSNPPIAGKEQVSWGLDRTDSREGLDNSYRVTYTGKGIHIFHMDTGVVA